MRKCSRWSKSLRNLPLFPVPGPFCGWPKGSLGSRFTYVVYISKNGLFESRISKGSFHSHSLMMSTTSFQLKTKKESARVWGLSASGKVVKILGLIQTYKFIVRVCVFPFPAFWPMWKRREVCDRVQKSKKGGGRDDTFFFLSVNSFLFGGVGGWSSWEWTVFLVVEGGADLSWVPNTHFPHDKYTNVDTGLPVYSLV